MRIGLNFDTYQRFLSSLTGRSRAILFAAIFCLFATFGFLTDIISVGRHSGVHVLFDVMFTGVMAALTAFATARKRWLLWPLLIAQLAIAVTIALPILHFRADLSTVEEVSIANLPLGFFADQAYSTGVVRCRPGDVLVLITDGLVEVFDRHDRELGLDTIKRVLVDVGRHAPAEILAALRETARAHGAQLDDQSALVLRVLEI
jgi:hypothetical protein